MYRSAAGDRGGSERGRGSKYLKLLRTSSMVPIFPKKENERGECRRITEQSRRKRRSLRVRLATEAAAEANQGRIERSEGNRTDEQEPLHSTTQLLSLLSTSLSTRVRRIHKCRVRMKEGTRASVEGKFGKQKTFEGQIRSVAFVRRSHHVLHGGKESEMHPQPRDDLQSSSDLGIHKWSANPKLAT